jgi:hypothetical protein
MSLTGTLSSHLFSWHTYTILVLLSSMTATHLNQIHLNKLVLNCMTHCQYVHSRWYCWARLTKC